MRWIGNDPAGGSDAELEDEHTIIPQNWYQNKSFPGLVNSRGIEVGSACHEQVR